MTTASATSPISHDSIQAQALERIRDDILAGHLPPGEPLRIDALASRLGVSHMPVREALHILVSEGLAERTPRRGVVVSELSAGSVIQAYHTLAALEAQAAQAAAQIFTAQDLAELRAIHAQWSSLPADAPRAELLALNRRFHDRYEAAVPNLWRDEFCRQLRNYIYRLRNRLPQAAPRIAAMGHEHDALLEAFAAHDAEHAGRLAHAHCLASLADLLARLADEGVTA
jgi:DNA-binding GntR family transcriptional regulator